MLKAKRVLVIEQENKKRNVARIEFKRIVKRIETPENVNERFRIEKKRVDKSKVIESVVVGKVYREEVESEKKRRLNEFIIQKKLEIKNKKRVEEQRKRKEELRIVERLNELKFKQKLLLQKHLQKSRQKTIEEVAEEMFISSRKSDSVNDDVSESSNGNDVNKCSVNAQKVECNADENINVTQNSNNLIVTDLYNNIIKLNKRIEILNRINTQYSNSSSSSSTTSLNESNSNVVKHTSIPNVCVIESLRDDSVYSKEYNSTELLFKGNVTKSIFDVVFYKQLKQKYAIENYSTDTNYSSVLPVVNYANEHKQVQTSFTIPSVEDALSDLNKQIHLETTPILSNNESNESEIQLYNNKDSSEISEIKSNCIKSSETNGESVLDVNEHLKNELIYLNELNNKQIDYNNIYNKCSFLSNNHLDNIYFKQLNSKLQLIQQLETFTNEVYAAQPTFDLKTSHTKQANVDIEEGIKEFKVKNSSVESNISFKSQELHYDNKSASYANDFESIHDEIENCPVIPLDYSLEIIPFVDSNECSIAEDIPHVSSVSLRYSFIEEKVDGVESDGFEANDQMAVRVGAAKLPLELGLLENESYVQGIRNPEMERSDICMEHPNDFIASSEIVEEIVRDVMIEEEIIKEEIIKEEIKVDAMSDDGNLAVNEVIQRPLNGLQIPEVEHIIYSPNLFEIPENEPEVVEIEGASVDQFVAFDMNAEDESNIAFNVKAVLTSNDSPSNLHKTSDPAEDKEARVDQDYEIKEDLQTFDFDDSEASRIFKALEDNRLGDNISHASVDLREEHVENNSRTETSEQGNSLQEALVDSCDKTSASLDQDQLLEQMMSIVQESQQAEKVVETSLQDNAEIADILTDEIFKESTNEAFTDMLAFTSDASSHQLELLTAVIWDNLFNEACREIPSSIVIEILNDETKVKDVSNDEILNKLLDFVDYEKSEMKNRSLNALIHAGVSKEQILPIHDCIEQTLQEFKLQRMRTNRDVIYRKVMKVIDYQLLHSDNLNLIVCDSIDWIEWNLHAQITQDRILDELTRSVFDDLVNGEVYI